ncbi:MAG TPA: hypothetical protein VIR33_17040 [Thermopolyspora sp.]|jgi:hypothetical protein
MSVHASPPTKKRGLSPKERAFVVLLGTLIVTSGAWLWAVASAPGEAKELMAFVGGAAAVLLSCAAAIVVHYAATVRLLRDRARQADAQVIRLEQEALRLTEETLPALGRQVREGVPAAEALAGLPQPFDGTFHDLLKTVGHELGLLEREFAAARAAIVSMEAGPQVWPADHPDQAQTSFGRGEYGCRFPAPEFGEIIAKTTVEVLLDRLPDVADRLAEHLGSPETRMTRQHVIRAEAGPARG